MFQCLFQCVLRLKLNLAGSLTELWQTSRLAIAVYYTELPTYSESSRRVAVKVQPSNSIMVEHSNYSGRVEKVAENPLNVCQLF